MFQKIKCFAQGQRVRNCQTQVPPKLWSLQSYCAPSHFAACGLKLNFHPGLREHILDWDVGNMTSHHDSAYYQHCGLGQVAFPLEAFMPSSIKR